MSRMVLSGIVAILVCFGKEQTELTKRVLLPLEKIGTIAVEKREELEPVTRQASELEGVVKRLVLSLIELGSSAVENRDDSTAHESARVLAKLTTSSKEVVKVAIDEVTMFLEYRDSFQKFMNLYKQHLKKPHP